MDLKVTKKMREVAPGLCNKIDELRKHRLNSLKRCTYLRSLNKEDAAAEEQQRIRAIDAEVAPLHAAAKQKMLEGLSERLATDASVLQNVSEDIEKVGDSMTAENKRHYEQWRSSELNNRNGTA